MEFKEAPFKVKAGTDKGLPDGSFDGYASVFGNVDSYGDTVEPGAFTKTLDDWKSSGGVIPVLWGHDMEDPFSNIGGLTSATQDDKGLHVVGQLDMDNPKAQQVYRLMKGGRTNKMSFAYTTNDSAFDADEGVNHLKDLTLYEVSVVQVPANDQAAIESVKSGASALVSGVKSGRVLAQKHIDSLHSAYDALGSVIAAAEGTDGDDSSDGSGKSDTSEGDGSKASAGPEEPGTVKGSASVETGGSGSSVKALSALQAILLLED